MNHVLTLYQSADEGSHIHVGSVLGGGHHDTLPPFSDLLLQLTGGVSVGSLLSPMSTDFCMEDFSAKNIKLTTWIQKLTAGKVKCEAKMFEITVYVCCQQCAW